MTETALPVIRQAHLRDLDPRMLYLILQLREEVFTLEQHATEADLDGRDLEDTTVLVWAQAPSDAPADLDAFAPVLAHARVLTDVDADGRIEAMRIGRMVVSGRARRGGWGRKVMMEAVAVCGHLEPEVEIRIDAQAYLEAWYTTMGFVRTGPVFLEAGIEHVEMIRQPEGSVGDGAAVRVQG